MDGAIGGRGLAPRARWLTVVAVGMAALTLGLVIVRQAVWGGGRWTDWALPLSILSTLGVNALGRGRLRPGLARGLSAANFAVVLAIRMRSTRTG